LETVCSGDILVVGFQGDLSCRLGEELEDVQTVGRERKRVRDRKQTENEPERRKLGRL